MNYQMLSILIFLMILLSVTSCFGESEFIHTEKIGKPLGDVGSFSIKIRPRQDYLNGENQTQIKCDIAEIPQIGKLYFQRNSSNCLLGWDWDWSISNDGEWVGVYIPDLPRRWYYLQYTWDSKRGLNDAYLNGTPLRVPQVKSAPWKLGVGNEIKINTEYFEIEDIETENIYLCPDDAAKRVPKDLLAKSSELLGIRKEVMPMEVEKRLGKVLYESKMNCSDSLKGWKMEGPGKLSFVDNWLDMSSELVNGEPKGNLVYWCPEDFPDSFVAEFEVKVTSEYGLSIMFFAAKGENGEDIFDESLPKRDGTFKQYTSDKIVSYHISYYADVPKGQGRPMANLRKNNRFYLITNGPVPIQPKDKIAHKIKLIKDKNHIQFLTDGKVIIDYIDDGTRYGKPLGGGKIGLRQMEWTSSDYRNFKVTELKNK